MSFARDLTRFRKKLEGRTDDVFKQTVIEINRRLVNRTPKLTGALASNWVSSIGNPLQFSVTNISPDGNVAKRAAELVFNNLKTGQVAYMTNSLPYAKRIEFGGHSAKAPNGMMRITIREFQDIANLSVRAI